MPTLPRPEGHHTVTPGSVVPDAARVIEFLEQAFGGKVLDRYDGPGGVVMHCEVLLGDSVFMLGDPQPGFPPQPAMCSFYVADAAAVDATYEKALALGATSERTPRVEFYGQRVATVRDVGGNKWTIAAVVEDVSREEMHRRLEKLMQG